MYRLFFLAFAATLASCSSPQNEEQPGPAEGQKIPLGYHVYAAILPLWQG